MSDKLTIKQMQEVALQKNLPSIDEESGYVLHESNARLVTEDEFGAKAVKVCTPSDKQMDLINAQCLEPQEKENWMIIKGVNPLGVGSEPDSHHDVFDKAAERDMAKQAFWTPIIKNHDHEMNPPIGRCLEATAGKDGLRETWAIPKASYNAEYREALLQGNMPEISIGAFISPMDKICNSCGDKSIYSHECSHYPGDKNGTTVTIRRVKRYAERSLVNIPARLGTSVKSLAPESLTEAYEKAKEDSISKEMAPNYDHLKETFQSFPTASDIEKAVKDALHSAFGGDDGSPATITPVINEKESSVSEVDNKNVEAPEAQEPSEKQETAPAEAAASEEATAPEQEVKSVEVPVIKELELEELTKSFKVEVEPVTKALAEVNEKFVQLNELQEKNAKDLGALTEIVTKLAQHVEALGNFSSEDVLNQVVELVAQLKDQKATEPINKAPENFSDFVSSLVAKKQEIDK